MNKVILIGRLGADPDMRYTTAGKAVCELRIATDNGKDKPAEWHRVVLWEKTAEVAAKHLTKGRQVAIEGRIQTRNYDDKEGQKRWITEVIGDRMEFIGDKRVEDKPRGDVNSTPPADDFGPDNDIPF